MSDQWLQNKYQITGEGIIEIPRVLRSDLAQWFHDLGFKVGVEVGVAAGEYSEILCQTNPQATIYGIDPWIAYDGYGDYKKESTFNRMYNDAMTRMRGFPNWKPIQAFSMDAVKQFEDESLDFVYIDANHAEPYVSQDINAWAKKVRKGGIVSGHDYIRLKSVRCDVIDALEKYTKENNINPLYILGTKPRIPENLRDESRSWLFFK